MRILLILLTFLVPAKASFADKTPIVKIRNLLIQAAESKKANKELIALLATCETNVPLVDGYRGASVMVEAKHMFNPLSRWNKFKEGKALIEEAIKNDGDSYELRYLRFCIQTHIPPVLGYSANIQSDKKFLMDRLPQVNDTDLKNRVLNYLMASKVCTNEEMNKLKQWKSK
jgi:oligoribonuclease (3'-5' exoribonuclease)